MPCTTLLVGKNASYDGSTIVARNEDSPSGEFTPKKFIVVQPQDQPRTYTSVISHLTIELPEEPLRYTAVPNALPDEGIWGEAGVNEANVSMSATETLTTNERVLGLDPFVVYQPAQGKPGDADYKPEVAGGIGEEDMLTLVLPYIRSAREGVLRLGALLEQYGTYEMNGIAFSDVNEIWWLETVGGHHWIARRVPDDAYVTVPNQLGIDSFDLDDALGEGHQCLCSADLREFMAAGHLDLTIREHGDAASFFNPREAFGSHSDSDHIYNTPRAWAMQRFLSPHNEDWGGEEADFFKPTDDDIPWARQPERKVTIEDVKYALSLHFQGTPYDPYGRLGTEQTRGMFRPIGINRNGQLAVVQLRPYTPQETCAIQWIAYGSNPFNTLVPIYANINTTPAYLANTQKTPTTESFYWANRLIAVMADAHFNACLPNIERYQQRTGGFGHALIAKTDAAVAKLLAEHAEGDAAGEGEVTERMQAMLEAANEEMACELKKQTDDLLEKTLYTASMGMKNGFSRSDG